jgi:hypothetical protein
MMPRPPFSAFSLTVLGMALFVLGCARAHPDRPPTFPARGSLFVGSKPAAGARIRLHATGPGAEARLCPHAEVGLDGTFSLTTFRTHDGAPQGVYAVTVTWPLPPRPGKEEGKDRFRGRYADPERPVQRVQIEPGDNVLEPIRLP